MIPRVSQTPGVAGYWVEPLDGKGISVTLWQSSKPPERPLSHPAPEFTDNGSQGRQDRNAGSDWAGLARSRTDLGTSRVGRGWCTVGLDLFTRALPMGA